MKRLKFHLPRIERYVFSDGTFLEYATDPDNVVYGILYDDDNQKICDAVEIRRVHTVPKHYPTKKKSLRKRGGKAKRRQTRRRKLIIR